MKKNLLWIGAFVVMIFLWADKCDSDIRKERDGSTNSCDYSATLEEVKQCASGVWITKKAGDIWKKIVIKDNGMYDMYEATPDSGAWGSTPDRSGSYSIDEARYSDTGKKYIYIQLDDSGLCSYRIVFDGSMSSLECNGSFENIHKGDVSPWK